MTLAFLTVDLLKFQNEAQVASHKFARHQQWRRSVCGAAISVDCRRFLVYLIEQIGQESRGYYIMSQLLHRSDFKGQFFVIQSTLQTTMLAYVIELLLVRTSLEGGSVQQYFNLWFMVRYRLRIRMRCANEQQASHQFTWPSTNTKQSSAGKYIVRNHYQRKASIGLAVVL